MHTATVTEFNAKWRRFVAKDAAGKFSAFALDGPGKVKRGDALQWEAMPGRTVLELTNCGANETLRATALVIAVSRAHAEAFLKAGDQSA